MTTRRWMAVVLYVAVDFAAFHGVITWDSKVALALFILLTLLIPFTAFLWWVIRQVRPNSLY